VKIIDLILVKQLNGENVSKNLPKLVVGIPLTLGLLVAGVGEQIATADSFTSTSVTVSPLTCSFGIVRSVGVIRNGVVYGNINLLYNSCTRTVEAQLTNAPVYPLMSNDAQVFTNGNVTATCTYFAPKTSCTTSPVNDAGVTSVAYGEVILSPTSNAHGTTGAF
jgi:hypothetical protein